MKFLYLRHATQFDERHAPRFFRRHSGAQVVFDVHRQMAFQLLGEFTLASPAIQHPEEPHHPAAYLSNVYKLHGFLSYHFVIVLLPYRTKPTLPNLRKALATASSGASPRARRSRMTSSRWLRISASSSSSRCLLRNQLSFMGYAPVL